MATSRPDLASLPRGGWTRFAPAPTGYLHLGHVANAVWVWGVARVVGARVVLRIDDHDRIRSRPEYDAAVIEDLAWLGFAADRGPTRHTDSETPYRDALHVLTAQGLVYGCDCTRSTIAEWAEANDRPWSGPGCPGGCRNRGLDGPVLRAAMGGGGETWMDAATGPCAGDVAETGDVALRDRDGNWTYVLTVVVDDLREDIDLVIRGRDLLHATPSQIRLGRLLGRAAPPTFLHHPLILRPDGRKLSKSSGDTAVRELRVAGRSAEEVIGAAARASGWEDPS
ncbi:MAG: tRNA glutamyl-Q(34) synthetase GluQRS [Chloroflexi bacterium]|nr:tRNA glutamyl-Q(34) synthetase GluQRS [Chloroflexota bacterium]